MFKKAVIIPTGDELASGIVLDTDSPAIMGQLLAINGNAFVARCAPVVDKEASITETVRDFSHRDSTLLCLLGAAAADIRYSSTLGKVSRTRPLTVFLQTSMSASCTAKTGICGASWL